MPYYWNVTRLEANKIMVNQVVNLPKSSELSSESYVGTLNGMNVTKDLMIDLTNSTKDVVHFVIPKPDAMEIAQLVNMRGQTGDGLMKFYSKAYNLIRHSFFLLIDEVTEILPFNVQIVSSKSSFLRKRGLAFTNDTLKRISSIT
jgi:hypothetical protein